MQYFSGCNYWTNTGKVPEEPLGAATAVYECDGCERLEFCLMKQTSEVFPLDPLK